MKSTVTMPPQQRASFVCGAMYHHVPTGIVILALATGECPDGVILGYVGKPGALPGMRTSANGTIWTAFKRAENYEFFRGVVTLENE